MRSLVTLENGWGQIPKGMTLTVDKRHQAKLWLKSAPCPHCDLRVSISRVPLYKVEIVENEGEKIDP